MRRLAQARWRRGRRAAYGAPEPPRARVELRRRRVGSAADRARPCAFEGGHRQGGEGGKQEQRGGGEAAITERASCSAPPPAAGPARNRRRAALLAAPAPTGLLLMRRPRLLVHARAAAAATMAPRVARSRAALPPAASCPGPRPRAERRAHTPAQLQPRPRSRLRPPPLDPCLHLPICGRRRRIRARGGVERRPAGSGRGGCAAGGVEPSSS